jgi:hypothetical protein
VQIRAQDNERLGGAAAGRRLDNLDAAAGRQVGRLGERLGWVSAERRAGSTTAVARAPGRQHRSGWASDGGQAAMDRQRLLAGRVGRDTGLGLFPITVFAGPRPGLQPGQPRAQIRHCSLPWTPEFLFSFSWTPSSFRRTAISSAPPRVSWNSLWRRSVLARGRAQSPSLASALFLLLPACSSVFSARPTGVFLRASFSQLGFRQPLLSYPRQHTTVVVFIEFANALLLIRLSSLLRASLRAHV